MTNLQKLVFLHVMNENDEQYDFVPYKYGPYSFQLALDVDVLCRDGYLRYEGGRIYTNGQRQIRFSFSPTHERGDALIRKVYETYPYYAINSEIINRLFSDSEVSKFVDERKKYENKQEILFTIGYEGKSVETFANQLIKNGVHLLCDVRRNPLSRKFGFTKSKLEHIIKNVGIQYYHIPELGIESEKRVSLNTIADYEALFEDYSRTLPQRQRYIRIVYDLIKQHKRIALMCFEKEAYMCHRHVIRDYIVDNYHVRSEDL